MFCSQCGNQMSDSQSFCDKCGAPVKRKVSQQAENKQAAAPQQAPSNQAQAPQQAQAAQAAPTQQAQNNQPAVPQQAQTNQPAVSQQAQNNQSAVPQQTTNIQTGTPQQAPSNQSATPQQAPGSHISSVVPSTPGPRGTSPISQHKPPTFAPSPAVSGAAPVVQAAGAAAAAQPKKNNRMPLIIGIAAAVVVVIAAICIYFFVLAPKPCYVVTERIDNIAAKSSTVDYERDENGMILKTTTIRDGKTDISESKELVEGLAISINDTGTYELNSDGYISKYEIKDSKGSVRYSRTYEYYSPGIIKSALTNNSDGSTITDSYDEDGWLTSTKTTSKNGKDSTVVFTYTTSADGKSFTRNASSTSSGSYTVYVFELDDNDYISSMYTKDDPSSRVTYTYEKVNNPDKMVFALSRLKS